MSDRLPAMPDRGRFIAYLRFLGVFCLLFFPVYFIGGWISEHSGRAMALHLDSELSIPLVPVMVWPYLSLYPLFLLPLFHLDEIEMAQLSRQSVAMLIVATLIFLALPGEIGFPPAQADGLSGAVIKLIRSVDTPHNLVPSLHVAFACLILVACAENSPRILKTAYAAWIVLMSLSTLFVHQHHLLDVISAIGLALVIRRIMPLGARVSAR